MHFNEYRIRNKSVPCFTHALHLHQRFHSTPWQDFNDKIIGKDYWRRLVGLTVTTPRHRWLGTHEIGTVDVGEQIIQCDFSYERTKRQWHECDGLSFFNFFFKELYNWFFFLWKYGNFLNFIVKKISCHHQKNMAIFSPYSFFTCLFFLLKNTFYSDYIIQNKL